MLDPHGYSNNDHWTEEDENGKLQMVHSRLRFINAFEVTNAEFRQELENVAAGQLILPHTPHVVREEKTMKGNNTKLTWFGIGGLLCGRGVPGPRTSNPKGSAKSGMCG